MCLHTAHNYSNNLTERESKSRLSVLRILRQINCTHVGIMKEPLRNQPRVGGKQAFVCRTLPAAAVDCL
jgi:hypothetical protein